MTINPCPRCGGQPILTVRTLITRITCRDCGYMIIDNDKDVAVAKWNGEGNKGGGCEACGNEK